MSSPRSPLSAAHLPLLLGLLAGAILIGILWSTFGYAPTARLLRVPAAGSPFMDVAVITDGAASFREGKDPLRENPHDISGRTLNYPRIWQGLYRLGLNEHHLQAFGIGSVALFLLGVVLASPGIGWRAGWVLLAVFSPTVLLCAERGNTDLILFFLLALAAALFRRVPWLTVALLVLAFVLKLYPLAALPLLSGRGWWFALGAGGAVLAIVPLYLLLSWNDLVLIKSGTPQGYWLAYGCDVVAWKLNSSPTHLATAASWAGGIAGLLVLGSAVVAARRDRPEPEENLTLDAFRVGAAIYIGTFLTGTHFIYRLLFLVLVIPQLLAWRDFADVPRRRVAGLTLASVLLSLWALALDPTAPSNGPAWPVVFWATQGLLWMSFASLAWLLVDSRPAWLSGAIERQQISARSAAAASPERPRAGSR